MLRCIILCGDTILIDYNGYQIELFLISVFVDALGKYTLLWVVWAQVLTAILRRPLCELVK